jgi:predicted transcriptional regulator of viral defense system
MLHAACNIASVKAIEALRTLAALSANQWGLFTAAQAEIHGVDRVTLSRLTSGGHLERLAHGVYRDAGAPSDEHEALRAAWLSVRPELMAYDRLGNDLAASTPITGTAAAELHGIGDLYVDRFELTTPVRRQSQRSQIHYVIRDLATADVTLSGGLPVTTLERTIADLVIELQALPHIAKAVSDAWRQRPLEEARVIEMLTQAPARDGYRRGDGAGLWWHIQQLAGLSGGQAQVPHVA